MDIKVILRNCKVNYMTASNTKGRLLFLEHFLTENTSDEHPVTMDELTAVYAEHGYKANRNTVRDDIEILQSVGVDVIVGQRGKYKVFYIGSRLFELAELKMLADAVASSRFITADKSEGLIVKLTKLTDEHNRQQIINGSLPINRLKTLSPGIFRTVDTVSTAITDGKKISFQYIDILPTKEIVLRHDGKEYKVSPQTLVWNDDRYYAPSYSEEKKCIVPFRIDRMREVKVLDDSAYIDPQFNIADYSRMVLQMFDGNEEECEVTLTAENKYMLNIIDRFGEDVPTEIIDMEHFSAKVAVRPSSTFFAWVFQFRSGIRIQEPCKVAESYKAMLEQALNNN